MCKMKTRYYILAIAIIGFFIVLSLPNYQITIEKVNNKLISFVSGAVEPWIIEGDSVYIDDVNILLNITPHTSNLPVIDLMTKAYSGEIDAVLLFNTTKVTPTKAEYNPHLENVTKSYTCNYEFNYTLAPNYFWCYQTILTYDNATNTTNGSYTNVVFEHSFLTGNIPTQTAYWTEEEIVWTDVSGAWTPVDIDFLGYNKGYYIKGFNITALQHYKLRLTLQPNSINEPSYKYFFGVKPSNETLQEAIDNGHFYFIDPWTEGLTPGLQSVYLLDENASATGTILDAVDSFDCTNDNADGSVTGYSNLAYDFDDTSSNKMTCYNTFSINDWSGITISAMVKTVDGGEIIGFRDNVGNDYFKFRLRIGTNGGLTNNNYIGVQEWSADGATTYSIESPMVIGNGDWHHIVAAWNYSTGAIRLYVDGISVGNSTDTGGQEGHDNDFTLGSLATDGGYANYFDGIIDEVDIWNKSLTHGEVLTLNNGNDTLIYGSGVVEDCIFNGTVKDGDGNAINGARIVINYAESDSFFGNATSDANGLWNLNVTADGNFTVYAYQPSNITRPGDIKSYVECIRT